MTGPYSLCCICLCLSAASIPTTVPCIYAYTVGFLLVYSGTFYTVYVHIQSLYMEGWICHRFLISYKTWGVLYIFGVSLGCISDYINSIYWGVSCYDWLSLQLWEHLKLSYLPAETAKELNPEARDPHCTLTRRNTRSGTGMHRSVRSECCASRTLGGLMREGLSVVVNDGLYILYFFFSPPFK